MENKIWMLNPDYVFRNDKDRICMFSKRSLSHNSTIEFIGYIHPTQAMILSLFTEPRPAKEIITALAKHLSMPYDKTYNLIKDFMGNKTPIYTEWQDSKIAFPKNVLIECTEADNDFSYDFCFDDLQCSSIDLTQDRNHRGPHSALWMLTNKCVTNCKYCYADRKTAHEPLSTERILEIIDEFARLRMGYVDVIGGEVFLRKDWDIIITKLVDCGMSPTYISTKLPVTNSIVERLHQTGYRKIVQLSLDSLDDNTLGQTIDTKTGYIDKIKKGISFLEEYNFPIQIDTILTSVNATIDEINALYSYIKDIKGLTLWEIRVPESSLYTPITFSQVKASRSALKSIQDYIEKKILPKAKIKIIFSAEALDETFRKEGPEKGCFRGGTCGILRNRIFILPDGKVSVCEQLYWHKEFIIGDLKTSSVEEIWNSERAIKLFNMSKSLFRDSSPCKKCLHSDECIPKKRRCLVKVVKAYGLENWDYPDPRCKFAPPILNDLVY